MLSYTFSRREKALLLLLAVVLILVAWYGLVYQSSTNRINQMNSRIAEVQSETTLAQAQVAQMKHMQSVIDQQKAAGVPPKTVPNYDNMQPLMAFLDAAMGGAASYEMKFEDLNLSNASYVQRPVLITFTTGTYESSEALVTALVNGPYTCVIDSLSIVQNNTTTGLLTSMVSGASSTGTSYSCTAHVTFYEKYPPDGSLKPVVATASTSTSASTTK